MNFFWGRRSNWARVIALIWLPFSIDTVLVAFPTAGAVVWVYLGVHAWLLEVAIVFEISDATKRRRAPKTGDTK